MVKIKKYQGKRGKIGKYIEILWENREELWFREGNIIGEDRNLEFEKKKGLKKGESIIIVINNC